MKEVNTQNLWIFERGTQEGINVPIWIIVAFQQSDRQHDQNLNIEIFYRPLVSSAQYMIGTEKHPDSGILLKYNHDDYSQGFAQIEDAKLLELFQKTIYSNHVSENDFRSTNEGNNIGYNLNVFDIRYQKNFESAQPIKVEIKFDGVVSAEVYAYALVLINKLVSISCVGQ